MLRNAAFHLRRGGVFLEPVRYYPTTLLCAALATTLATGLADDLHQYAFDDIAIPRATEDEPVRKDFSLAAAASYVEDGAKAWSGARKCVSCHTNGSYMLARPALSKVLGPPNREARAFFVGQFEKLKKKDVEELRGGIAPTQIAYIAAGLAEWDKHVTGELSPETTAALQLMFDVQSDDGSFSNEDCWPPLESSDYHSATVAALAVASAPGWSDHIEGELKRCYDKLLTYLKTTEPPHDYGRVLRLWVATAIPELMAADRKQEVIAMVRRHQNSDGGWALRTFAKPKSWGSGNRADKLRAEDDFKDIPQSDGHMTGLAIMVLRAAGIPKTASEIQRAVDWLKSNQRESGRWWTRSLNTDKAHFITYSGTCYPLLALHSCDALESKPVPRAAADADQ